MRHGSIHRSVLAGLGLLAVMPPCLVAQEARGDHLPWLEQLGAIERLADVHTLSSDADVTVSDGLTYSTLTLFHDRQRAVFRRIYEDRTITQGIAGRYIWSFDGDEQTEAPPVVEDIVLGHQVHAQILFFDRLHPEAGPAAPAEFAGRDCLKIADQTDDGAWSLFFDPAGLPLGMARSRAEAQTIVFSFDDWRPVDGILLPFAVHVDDGERKFDYEYSNVWLNEGSLETLRPPIEALTDEQQLLRLHRNAMDDHLFGRTDRMRTAYGDALHFLDRGDVFPASATETGEMLDRIMASRDYAVYDDMIRPIVSISDDETLGWLIARVFAQGVRFDEEGRPAGPLQFISSWVELYRKEEGRWRLQGVASTFAPEQEKQATN